MRASEETVFNLYDMIVTVADEAGTGGSKNYFDCMLASLKRPD